MSNFETGDLLIIDEHNADSWTPIIGKPLADALKKPGPRPKAPNFQVISVDKHLGIITIGKIDTDE